MLRKAFAEHLRTVTRLFSSTNASINLDKLEKEVTGSEADVLDEDSKLLEERIELSRNKSRLRTNDRNLLFDQDPYPEEMLWFHGTLKYKRRQYGRYGESCGVNPALCWPIEQELNDMKEYERVAYPQTIPEMLKIAQEKRRIRNEEVLKRQRAMLEKISKLDTWKREMQMKIAAKEAEAKAARERRERLIEEVRKHFGYKVDPKDEKFKELLEKKEKEQRKVMKEARKKAKEEKLMKKLQDGKRDKAETALKEEEN